MKIQCSCGAKYAFDVSPEMVQTPARFVCPACGVDSSDLVNHLIRQELGVATPVQPTSQPPPVSRARIQTPETDPVQTAPAAPQRCFKHPDQFVTGKCCICSKPICPRCMDLFGCVCSPLCRGRAEAQGIEIPVYAGQRAVREARTWRRTVAVAGTVSGLIVAMLGVWLWYEVYGSRPRTVWSVRFAEPSYSGQSAFCGKDQVVFLHGDTLARYNVRLKKEIWSRHLVDQKEIEAAIAREMKEMQALIDKANNENPDHVPKMPDPEKLRKSLRLAAEQALDLRVRGENIWVLSPGKLTRYDHDTGNLAKEIPVPAGYGGLISFGNELLNVDLETGKPIVTRINLTTCETRTEQLSGTSPGKDTAAQTDRAEPKPAGGGIGPGKRSSGKAGLPVGLPGKDAGQVMDPKKVAEQAQRLSYPAQIALPAVLAHNLNQERTLAAYDDQPAKGNSSAGAGPEFAWRASLIPTKEGLVQFSVKLLEHRIATREAMKPAPAKSALDGNLTVAKTADLANDMLNEAQRARGGQVVQEDESRYQVTLRRSEGPGVWSGEVIGFPSLFPLATVNVLAANKTVLVFDQACKKLWEATLRYNVSGGHAALDPDHAPYGLRPCVEHKDALYIMDEGVLTAFDRATGNVRWRLPSVGATGLFFDDEGMIYLNTSTASPETIRYANQIDITRKTTSVIMKLDPQTGKVLWMTSSAGLVNYVSGKFLYGVHSYQADDDEESGPYTMDSMLGRESSLSIKRINPKNGRVLWEHVQKRAPLDVQFDRNTIRLVFRKEAQVLKFLAL